MENIQYQNEIVEKPSIFFNGAEQSSFFLINEAIKDEIGFLDLYSYHIINPNKKQEEYIKNNQNKKTVNVGIEFSGEGQIFNGRYYINYDALEFIRLVHDKSVEIVNIDFPLFTDKYKKGNLSDKEFEHLSEINRILKPEGKVNIILSMVDFKNQQQKEKTKKQIEKMGYKNIEFLYTNDFIEKSKFYAGYEKLIGITAIKK